MGSNSNHNVFSVHTKIEILVKFYKGELDGSIMAQNIKCKKVTICIICVKNKNHIDSEKIKKQM